MSNEHATTTHSDQTDTPAIVLVGLVGSILVFVIIVALQALFYNAMERENINKFYNRDSLTMSRLRSEQLEKINGYRWIDKENGVVAIPIDRAMELTVQELSQE